MRIAILTNSDKGYVLLKEHLSFRQVEQWQGIEIAKGKLQNQPVLIMSCEHIEPLDSFDLIGAEEIPYIISLGFAEEYSPPLAPGDILIAGEIDMRPTNAKLVDWCLAAVDEMEELSVFRTVVGSLHSSTPVEIKEGNVFAVDKKAAQLAACLENQDTAILFVRFIKDNGKDLQEDQCMEENGQISFWLVKGILGQISKYRQNLTSDIGVV